jgi:hypothetical protein
VNRLPQKRRSVRGATTIDGCHPLALPRRGWRAERSEAPGMAATSLRLTQSKGSSPGALLRGGHFLCGRDASGGETSGFRLLCEAQDPQLPNL